MLRTRPHILESGLTEYREADIVSGIMAENWAERIRAAVRAADLSMLALSREAGVPYSVVHDFITGKGNVNLRNAERICRVVGLDLRPVRRGKRRK